MSLNCRHCQEPCTESPYLAEGRAALHTPGEGILAARILPVADSPAEDTPGLDILAAHSLAVLGLADHSLAVHIAACQQVSQNRLPSRKDACDKVQPAGSVTMPYPHYA